MGISIRSNILSLGLSQLVGVDRDSIVLIMGGKTLVDYWTFEDYGINASSNIVMVVSMRAGT